MNAFCQETKEPRKQDNAQATLAPILRKEDGQIDFRRSARQICNRLRGFQPWPGAYTTFRGKNLNVWAAKPVEESGVRSQESAVAPGELSVDKDRLFVVCGERTVLELLTVQPEGKKRMAARDFVHGYHPKSGEHLGTEEHRDTEPQR